MLVHAWVEMDIRMNILMHGVDIHHPSTALTSIGMLRINRREMLLRPFFLVDKILDQCL